MTLRFLAAENMLMYHALGTGDRWAVYQGCRLVMVLDGQTYHREVLLEWNNRLRDGDSSELIEDTLRNRALLSSTFNT